MGKNREKKKEKQYNKKSSAKDVLSSKYIRKKLLNIELQNNKKLKKIII